MKNNDDTYVNQKILQRPETSSTAAALGGVPIAVATVWLIGYNLPAGVVLDPTAATAFGSLGATIFGELWLIYTRLRDKYLPPL